MGSEPLPSTVFAFPLFLAGSRGRSRKRQVPVFCLHAQSCSIKQFRELTACHGLQQTRSQPGTAGFAPRQKKPRETTLIKKDN